MEANEADKRISVFLEQELECDYLREEPEERSIDRRLVQKTLYYANCVFLKRYEAPLLSTLPAKCEDGPVFLDLHLFLEKESRNVQIEYLDDIKSATLSAIAGYCKNLGAEELISRTQESSLYKKLKEGEFYNWDEIIEKFPTTAFEEKMYEKIINLMNTAVEKTCYS